MTLPQTCFNPAAFLKLHSYKDLMLQSRIWGRASEKCVLFTDLGSPMLVTLSRLNVGANTGDVISPQPLHIFK